MAVTRRQFVSAAGAAGALSGQSETASNHRFTKGICRVIFPSAMPLEGCFRAARNAGFEAIELTMTGDLDPSVAADRVKRTHEQALKAGIAIAALWVTPLAQYPLNSPDARVRGQGVESIRKAIEFAGYLNCRALLVVPGRVGSLNGELIGYEASWERFTAELKKLVPLAEQARVVLAIENVSNKFLLSPRDKRTFVDQFNTSWVRSFFDIGNVMYTGYPEDWILTLGSRIARVHAKDRKNTPKAEFESPSGLLEGDVDWKSVISALVKVGYRGSISAEIGPKPDDPDHLKKVSAAMDTILAMA
ncbi:MAG TPA: sugar phosphate isomerase/epimerase family protein [Bryobacteraceae bacterium]|nr:sugar phosphate isomerase/epimerase family protein [Bryobacteraceae bacterium]